MAQRNFADPSYEPSDDDLHELARLAFASVPAEEARRRAKLREDIARERQAALARLRESRR